MQISFLNFTSQILFGWHPHTQYWMSGSSEILVLHTNTYNNQICEQSVATKRKFVIEYLFSLPLPFGFVFFLSRLQVCQRNFSAGIFMTLKWIHMHWLYDSLHLLPNSFVCDEFIDIVKREVWKTGKNKEEKPKKNIQLSHSNESEIRDTRTMN